MQWWSSGRQETGTHARRYNGGVLAFQVPASVKDGSLDPSQLPFKRLFPDPVDNFTAGIVAPRGMVIGGPGPLLYVADAAPPGQVLVANPTPPYAVRGALVVGSAYQMPCTAEAKTLIVS